MQSSSGEITSVDAPLSCEITFCEPAAVVGHYGNVLFTVTRQPFGMGWRATHDLAGELAGRYGGYVQLTIVEEGAGLLPDPDTRQRIAESAVEYAPVLISTAMVFEGSGVWERSMRLFARTVMLGMGGRAPKKIFRSVDQAIPWLFARSEGGEFDVPGLFLAVGKARRS